MKDFLLAAGKYRMLYIHRSRKFDSQNILQGLKKMTVFSPSLEQCMSHFLPFCTSKHQVPQGCQTNRAEKVVQEFPLF